LVVTANDTAGAVVTVPAGNVKFTSSDNSVVRVGDSGTLTAVAVGTSQVSVTESGSDKSATVTVTVTLVPTMYKMYAGQARAGVSGV